MYYIVLSSTYYTVLHYIIIQRDLLPLADSSLDQIYHAPSMSNFPEGIVGCMEVDWVLRPGRLYRVAHTNPVVEFIDLDSWHAVSYRIRMPYSVLKIQYGPHGSVQFRHHLQEIYYGLIEVGLSI